MAKQTVTIRMEPKLKARLKKSAKSARLSVGYLIEAACERFLADVASELSKLSARKVSK